MIGSIKKIFAKDLIAFIDILAFVQFWTNGIPKYQTQRRSMNLVEHLIYILCGFQPLTIFTKNSISDVWLGSEYVSAILPLNLFEILKLLNFSKFNPF